MPLHDWSRVDAGLYHDFHQTWTVAIRAALNAGLLPPGYSALVEQRTGSAEADVLAIEASPPANEANGGIATMARPTSAIIQTTKSSPYVRKANRVVVKHRLGRTVAVIEVVSPGNKGSRRDLDEFVKKAVEYLEAGVHLVIVDPFPPGRRDPLGLHALIWDHFSDEPFECPRAKNRFVVAYEAGEEATAYVEPVAVGDPLPEAPLFLQPKRHVNVPLERAYWAAWESCPSDMRHVVEHGRLPGE